MTSNFPSAKDIDRLIARISGTFLGVLLGLSPVWYDATGPVGMFVFDMVFLHFVFAFFISFFLYLLHPTNRPGWKWRGAAISLVANGGYVGGIALVALAQPFPEPIPDLHAIVIVVGLLLAWGFILWVGQWYASIRVVQAPD